MASPNVLHDETAPNTLRGGPTTRVPGMAANTMDVRGPSAVLRARPGISPGRVLAGLVAAGVIGFLLLSLRV